MRFAVIFALFIAALLAPLAVHGQIDVDAAISDAGRDYQLLESAAQGAEKARDYESATKLLNAALGIRRQVFGETSVEYGVGLVLCGDLANHRNSTTPAEDFYTRAVAILKDRPAAFPAITYLGALALMKEDFDKASGYFAQLQDPPALMWKAGVLSRQKKYDEADDLFRQALALNGPGAPASVAIREAFAASLRREGKNDEADGMQAVRLARIRKDPSAVPSNELDAPLVIVRRANPGYSVEAQAMLIAGTVDVHVVVQTNGVPEQISVVRGLGFGLDERAVDAIRQWRFRPGLKGGTAVPVSANLRVTFNAQ